MRYRPEQLRIPVSYLQMVKPVAERLGISFERVLQRLGLQASQVQMPGTFIDGKKLALLLRFADAFTPKERAASLGILRHFNPLANGIVGLATLAAPDVRRALAVVIEHYERVMIPGVGMGLEEKNGQIVLSFEPWCDLGPANHTLMELVLGSFTVGSDYATQPFLPVLAEFRHQARCAESSFSQAYGCPVHFSSRENRLVFDSSVGDIPLMTANEPTWQALLQQIARDLPVMTPSPSVVQQARSWISERLEAGQVPRIDDLAEALHMSPRTLRRRLAGDHNQFQQILEQVREQKARLKLLSGNQPIYVIAAECGYDNEANFSRAFRRWTGQSPKAFRQQSVP